MPPPLGTVDSRVDLDNVLAWRRRHAKVVNDVWKPLAQHIYEGEGTLYPYVRRALVAETYIRIPLSAEDLYPEAHALHLRITEVTGTFN